MGSGGNMYRIILHCPSNIVSPPCASFRLWHVLNALTVANHNIIPFTALYTALRRCSSLCCRVNWLNKSTLGVRRKKVCAPGGLLQLVLMGSRGV